MTQSFRDTSIPLKAPLCLLCSGPCAIYFGASLPLAAQSDKPDWCKNLPRPEYKSLEQVPLTTHGLKFTKSRQSTVCPFTSPHQAEEVISYLIVGTKQLFSSPPAGHRPIIKSIVGNASRKNAP